MDKVKTTIDVSNIHLVWIDTSRIQMTQLSKLIHVELNYWLLISVSKC